MTSGHHLHLDVPRPALAGFEDALSSLGGAVVTGGPDLAGDVPVDVYLAEEPDAAEVAALIATAAAAAGIAEPQVESQPLPDIDWVAKCYEGLPPIVTGRFFVYGQHNADTPPPAGAIAFHIEANQAFGTGRHESTQGCLIALEDLAKRGIRVRRGLDMGAGSGILAFAMARLWRRPMIAADNDMPSVVICAENAVLNGVGPWVRSVYSDGYSGRVVKAKGPYDLICANILAEPLAKMAGGLAANLAPGGRAILSGMLNHQAHKVFRRHRCHGLVMERRLKNGDWTTLVLRKPG